MRTLFLIGCLFVAGFAGSIAYNTAKARIELKELRTVDDYLVINEMEVPDHRVGEDPIVTYDRTVLDNFHALWSVDYHRLQEGGEFFDVPGCEGRGADEYAPNEKSSKMPLSKYSGVKCDLEPGTYRLLTVWRIADDAGRVYVRRHRTRAFVVSP